MSDLQPNRLQQFREHLRLNQRNAALEANVYQRDISKMEKGEAKPSPKYLSWLFSKGMDMNWFFSGNGSMFRKEKSAYPKGISGLIPDKPDDIKAQIQIINSEINLVQKELATLLRLHLNFVTELIEKSGKAKK